MSKLFTAALALMIISLSAVVLYAGDTQPGVSSVKVNPAEIQAKSILAYERQAQFYRSKVQRNPQDASAHNMLGVSLQGLKRVDDAIKEYKQATKLAPDYAEAWNNLGSAFHLRNKLKDAVKHYRKAIALKPELTGPYRNLGTALLALGKFGDGVAAYRRAYELDPAIFDQTGSSCAVPNLDWGMQYFAFAKISAAHGQIDAALDFLQKARIAGFKDFKKVETDPDFAKVVVAQRYGSLKEEEFQR